MRLCVVIFIRKNWSKSFNNGIVYDRVGFKCICSIFSRASTQLFYKDFTGANGSGRSKRSFNFRYILPGSVPNCQRGKIQVFCIKKFQIRLIFTTLLNPWTLSFKKNSHSENCITVEMSRRTQKVEIYLANEGSGLEFFSTDLSYTFGSNVDNEYGVMLRGKGPHKLEFVLFKTQSWRHCNYWTVHELPDI